MILKLLWPEVCPFCGRVFRKGICPACLKKIKKVTIEQPYCMKCGKPVSREEQEYCSDCIRTKHYFDGGRALWLHKSPVKESIYQFKYHNKRISGKYFAEQMYLEFYTLLSRWKPDLIIPIPLHIRRKRKRGYNQSEILAKKLGELCGVRVATGILQRKKYTNPQKTLDHRTRKKNIYNAFKVTKALRGIQTILLIDDIYTTGNTIDEAARMLKEAGVQNVYFLTVSIGQGN